jgi:hypothetical protein
MVPGNMKCLPIPRKTEKRKSSTLAREVEKEKKGSIIRALGYETIFKVV